MRISSFILTAGLLLSPAHAAIGFQQVLDDPDNVQLNMQYASEQLEVGNAKGALAAVERVLVAEPSNLPARLFRARVLMSLGADLQAEAELRALAILPLPPQQATLVADLLDQIRRRGQTFQSYLNVSVGMLDSDNVNNYPDSGKVTARGTETDYTYTDIAGNEFEEPQDDNSITHNVALNSIYKTTNSQFYDQIFFNIGQAGSSEGDTGYLGYAATNLGAGMRFVFGEYFVTPLVSYSDIDNDFKRTLGHLTVTNYRVSAMRKFGAKFDASLSVAQSTRDYEGDKKNRNGSTLSYTLGANYQLLPRLRVGLIGNSQTAEGETDKDLDKSVTNLIASAVFVPARYHVLRLSYSDGESSHDNIYTASVGDNTDGKKREDETSAYSANYSVSGQAVSPWLKGFRLNAGYSYSDTESNFTDFINDKTSLSVSIDYTLSF